MEKMHPATWPCHDCEKNIPVPSKFCVPATLTESKRYMAGEVVELPPLCYECWMKRTR